MHQDSLETVFRCHGLGLGLDGWCLGLGLGLGWCLGSKARQCDNQRVSVSQETTPSASSSSAPQPRKRLALLSYARPPVQSDISAASPDATLAVYITAINQHDFNPDDRPNIYAE